MTHAARISLAVATSVCVLGWPSPAALLPRSVSTSRQFIVFGSDAGLRGAICDLAELTKRNALAVLQQPDGWETPVVIHAQLTQADVPETPPAQLKLSQTGFGLKLQLELTIPSDVTAPAIQRELLRAILLERIYRQQPNTPAGTVYVEPPEWLLEGIIASAAGQDHGAFAEALQTHVAADKVLPLAEFLRQKPELLESPSRALYRAYAFALVATLRASHEGPARFSRFLRDLPQAGNDPAADLLAHFPELGDSPEKTEKIWTQSVARVAGREHYRMAACEETERQLAQLRVQIPQSGKPLTTYTLEEFPQFIRHPAANAALQQFSRELILLSAQAHPLFLPVIGEYQKAVALLLRGKPKRVAERLAAARATREQLSRRMSAIDDYLNWFEATQARTASGAFRDYLMAAEMAMAPEPRRRDRISVYLDALEAEF